MTAETGMRDWETCPHKGGLEHFYFSEGVISTSLCADCGEYMYISDMWNGGWTIYTDPPKPNPWWKRIIKALWP